MAFISEETNAFVHLIVDSSEFAMLRSKQFGLYFKFVISENAFVPTERTIALLSSEQLNDMKQTAIYVILRFCNKKFITLSLLKYMPSYIFAYRNANYTTAIMGLLIGYQRGENTYADNDNPDIDVFSVDEIVNYANYCPREILEIPDQLGNTAISLMDDLLKCKYKNNK
jgi:uncharacterized protein YfaT (DUF1175 family)